MAATFYGTVYQDGTPQNSGSENWQSEVRDDTDGLYKITLSGANSTPIPVVTVASNDLTSFQTGKECFINITDAGLDSNGRYYFGVAINNSDGQLYASSFTFTAD